VLVRYTGTVWYVQEGMVMDRCYCLYYLGMQFLVEVEAVRYISARRKVEWALNFPLPTRTALHKEVLEPLLRKCCASLDWSVLHYGSVAPCHNSSH